jgi:hypothetical protein
MILLPNIVMRPQRVLPGSKIGDCMMINTNNERTTAVLTHNHKRPVKRTVNKLVSSCNTVFKHTFHFVSVCSGFKLGKNERDRKN